MGLPMVGERHRRKTNSPESAAWKLGRIPKRVQGPSGSGCSSLNHQRTNPSSAVEGDHHCDSRSTLSRTRDAGRFLQKASAYRDSLRARRRTQVLFDAGNLRGLPEKVDCAEMGFLPARRCQSSPGGTVVENRASGTGQQGQDQKYHERLVQPRDTVGMDGQESNHASSSERQTLQDSDRLVSGRDSTSLLLHQGTMPDCRDSRCGERFARGGTVGIEVGGCEIRSARIERDPLCFPSGRYSLQDGSFTQAGSHECRNRRDALEMEAGSSIQPTGRLDFRKPTSGGNPTVLAWIALQGAPKTCTAEGGHFCSSRLAHAKAQFWNLDESQWRRHQDHPRTAAPRYLQSHSRHLHTSGHAGEARCTSQDCKADHGGWFRIKSDHADTPITDWTQTDPDSKGPIFVSLLDCWRPRRDLNPCYRRERAMS